MQLILVLCVLSVACVLAQTAGEIELFRMSLKGDVVRKGDDSYRKDRRIWNDKLAGSDPYAIVVPKDITDVQLAMKFFRQHNIHPRVKSGCHSFTGWNQQENGWVIYTRDLKDIEITKEGSNPEIRLGGGLTFASIYEYLDGTGYLFPGGTCPTVGISGYMLGGGQSVISRSFGMGSDALISVKMVTANGELVVASANENADLFWALRGAGHGNFGIVVEFTATLYRGKEDALFYGAFKWHGKTKKVKAVLKHFVKYMETAPKELSMQVQCMERRLIIQYFYTGIPAEGRKIIDAYERSLPVQAFSVKKKIGSQNDYVGMSAKSLGVYPVPLRTYLKSSLFTKLNAKYIDTLVETWQSWKIYKAIPSFVITALGGKVSQIPDASSAVMYRNALFSVEYAASWFLKRQNKSWIRNITKGKKLAESKLPQHHYLGPYVNYVDKYELDWERAYYGNKIQKLQQIKTRWDPSNRFEYEHGVNATS